MSARCSYRSRQAADRAAAPVIVELFTSEGCSSCPAADRLLARLEQTQPVPGAQVIAIEEHVDYWNQLGWADPFSSPQYRARQNDYAVAFHASNIYTPQMVVNGLAEFVGSDMNRAYHEIGAAAQAETTRLTLGPRRIPRTPICWTFRCVSPLPRPLNCAIPMFTWRSPRTTWQPSCSTEKTPGTPCGTPLWSAASASSENLIAKGASGGQLVSTLRLPHEWKRENLRAVVFVQERESFHITGAGVIDLH